MGLMEMAFLGAIAWIIMYTIYVFLQTLIYAALTGTSAFATFFVATTADTSQAATLFELGQMPISTIEIVCILLLIATGKFFFRFLSAFHGAVSSYLRPITG